MSDEVKIEWIKNIPQILLALTGIGTLIFTIINTKKINAVHTTVNSLSDKRAAESKESGIKEGELKQIAQVKQETKDAEEKK